MDADTPILPPLKSPPRHPAPLSPLQTVLSGLPADDKLQAGRPVKRSRLTEGSHDRTTTNESYAASAATALPAATRAGAHAVTPAGSDSNGGSEDRALAARGRPYGVLTTNSSSPSHGEYSLPAQGSERGGTAGRAGLRGSVDESQSNDWEAVVEMYTTGKGTEDGVALKMITKGDGRRVSDRKLLEKRRTIGKTYECLGVERFEAAIGYKWENGVRRKQKMYHVISRCRVVNAMRKAGESIPADVGELTHLIDERIAHKELLKEASKSGVAAGRRLSLGSGLAAAAGLRVSTSSGGLDSSAARAQTSGVESSSGGVHARGEDARRKDGNLEGMRQDGTRGDRTPSQFR